MPRPRLAVLLDRAVQLPLGLWVWLGFTLPYLYLFVNPIFFSGQPKMQFPEYVPAADPIGIDLRSDLGASSAWLSVGQNPYIDNS